MKEARRRRPDPVETPKNDGLPGYWLLGAQRCSFYSSLVGGVDEDRGLVLALDGTAIGDAADAHA